MRLKTSLALTAVKDKIPNVSNLLQKTNYNSKINEIEKSNVHDHCNKYITTQESYKFTSENFALRLA